MPKTIHVYSQKPASSYGGEFRVNNLAFYDRENNNIPITDIVTVNNNEVTFKINGIPGRLNVPLPYGAPYYPENLFRTEISESYSLMVQDNIGAPLENQGFWLYFDSDVKFSYITLAYYYNDPKDFMLVVDGKEAKELGNASREGEIFKMHSPVQPVRCIIGKNKRYYFLRPKSKTKTTDAETSVDTNSDSTG